MDVIGLIASVITVGHATVEGVEFAKSIYHTQDEFQALQVRLFMG